MHMLFIFLSPAESFRGDFDYLEALLNDIGPMETQESHHTQPSSITSSTSSSSNASSSSPHLPTQRRPPSMAPRATTSAAAFDLESTLKDLEDTFYNGLEGGDLKRTTSIITWPKEGQQQQPVSKKDDVCNGVKFNMQMKGLI